MKRLPVFNFVIILGILLVSLAPEAQCVLRPAFLLGVEGGPLHGMSYYEDTETIPINHPVFVDSSYFYPSLKRAGFHHDRAQPYGRELWGINDDADFGRLDEIFRDNDLAMTLYPSQLVVDDNGVDVDYNFYFGLMSNNSDYIHQDCTEVYDNSLDIFEVAIFGENDEGGVTMGKAVTNENNDEGELFGSPYRQNYHTTNGTTDHFLIGNNIAFTDLDSAYMRVSNHRLFALNQGGKDRYELRFLMKLTSEMNDDDDPIATL